MTTVLSQAHTNWATHTADESFLTLADLHAEALRIRERAVEAPNVAYSGLRVVADSGDVKLIGKQNVPASLTHWSFGQLCRSAGVKAGRATELLRELPATLTAQVLNNRLATLGNQAGVCKLLLDVNGDYNVRAFTGQDYGRIWDSDVTKRALQLADMGWQPAPVTELANGGSTRGLYKSDHDCFMMLVDNDRRVFEKAPGGGLSRGVMIANSEVGDKSFWFLTFLYSYICANHNVWGVEGVRELRVRHVGNAGDRAFAEMAVELKKYADSSTVDDEQRIEKAIRFQLAATKEQLLDKIFGMKQLNLSKRIIAEAYDAAEQHEQWYLASPTSAWGFGNGLTEVARAIPFADQRVEVERAAGRLMTMAF